MKNRVFILLLLLAGQLAAVEPVEPKKAWRFNTTLGLNLGHQFNQAFLGLQNGQVFSPGFQFEQVIRYYELPHEWRTELVLSEAWALSTPQTAFVKSSDHLQVKSTYLFHASAEFGPYGSAKLRTSVFPGSDLQDSATKYHITDAATGVQTTETSTGSAQTGTFRFPLTSAFLPLVLEQDAGIFYQPYHEEALLLELRAGATARQNIAKGQRVLTAVGIVYGDTPVRQLDNIYELGPSLGIHFKTEAFEKKISYRLSCDAMWSLLQTPEASVASNQQLSFDLSTGVGFNLLSWLSLHWQFKSILNPAVLEQVQMMSNLSLAFNYSN